MAASLAETRMRSSKRPSNSLHLSRFASQRHPSTQHYLHRLHQEQRGTQHRLDLVPDLDDPKNLFGALAGKPIAAPSRRPALAGAHA